MEHLLCSRTTCPWLICRVLLPLSFIIEFLDERRRGHTDWTLRMRARVQLRTGRRGKFLLTELQLNYAAFGPGESEDFVSGFSYTFGLHHADIVLVELEVGSSQIKRKDYLQTLTYSVALFT